MLPELSFFCYSSCIAHPQLRRMIGSLDTLLAVRGANGTINLLLALAWVPGPSRPCAAPRTAMERFPSN
jgi:hypothetical protein